MGKLRTLDDIFESAAIKVLEVEEGEGIDFTEQDIMTLCRLPCVHDAMRQICELKGDAFLMPFAFF